MTGPLPLVLVPGLLGDEDVWADQVAAVGAGRVTRVFRCGRQASIADMAEDLLRHAPDRFALTGSSMGGYVALAAAVRGDERIAGLALVATSARADDDGARRARSSGVTRALAGGFDAVAAEMAAGAASPLPADHPLVGRMVAMFHRSGPADYAAQQDAIGRRPDLRGRLGRIRCPTTVICGACDAVVPPSRSAELHRGIAGSDLHVIPAAGHAVTQAAPLDVTGALTAWLHRVDARAPATGGA